VTCLPLSMRVSGPERMSWALGYSWCWVGAGTGLGGFAVPVKGLLHGKCFSVFVERMVQ
jgi:hypothetical protein